MFISVNKKTNTRKPVKYAALNSALSGATTSGVWHDEESAKTAPRRQNRIQLMREPSVTKSSSHDDLDA